MTSDEALAWVEGLAQQVRPEGRLRLLQDLERQIVEYGYCGTRAVIVEAIDKVRRATYRLVGVGRNG